MKYGHIIRRALKWVQLKLSYIFDNSLSITHKNTFDVKSPLQIPPTHKAKENMKESPFSLIGSAKYDKIYISSSSYDKVVAAKAEVTQYYSR